MSKKKQRREPKSLSEKFKQIEDQLEFDSLDDSERKTLNKQANDILAEMKRKKEQFSTQGEKDVAEELSRIRTNDDFNTVVDVYSKMQDCSEELALQFEKLMMDYYINNFRPNTKSVYSDLKKIYDDKLNGLSKDDRTNIFSVMENCKKPVKEDRTEAQFIIEVATKYSQKQLKKNFKADDIAQMVFSAICKRGNGPIQRQYDPWLPIKMKKAYIEYLCDSKIKDSSESSKDENERLKKFLSINRPAREADPESKMLAYEKLEEKIDSEIKKFKAQKRKTKGDILQIKKALKTKRNKDK